MEDRNNRYERLYTELLARAVMMHENNKKRIRRGLFGLIIIPAVLAFIRSVTDSDKVLFLIIYILCMFALCAYLISIEYLDDSIQKAMQDVTNRDADFDDLLPRMESIQNRLSVRIAEINAARAAEEDKPSAGPSEEPASAEADASPWALAQETLQTEADVPATEPAQSEIVVNDESEGAL